MNQIDDRIVSLEFDNKQFESGAKQSLQTIEDLKNSMKFDDMSKNLSEFSQNLNKSFDLTGIQNAVESLNDKFSASGIAGMEVIRQMTDFAISAGKKMVSALSKPFSIMWEGGKSRAANIDQAKFMLEGLGVAWKDLYEDIDYAVAGTAYGLDAAATAASQLTASGVKAGEEMKKALRGISGVAAMTNAQYEEISPIFTTVAGQGKLMTMQLRQLESRGLNAAAELGKALGVTEQEVRDMVTDGKISFKMFSDAMDDAFGTHAKESNKTFEGALGNMQFALKKIGAEFAGPLREAAIPFFNEVRLMINAIKDNLSGVFPIFKDLIFLISNRFTNAIYAVTKFLKEDFTGAENIANGLKNIVQTVIRIVAAISTAFKEVFGASKSVGTSINDMAEGFERLTASLIPSNETLVIIKNVIASLLVVIKNIFTAVKPILSIIGKAVAIVLKLVAIITSLIIKFAELQINLFKASGLFKAIQASGGVLSFVFEKITTALIKLKGILSDNSTVLGRFMSTVKSVASNIALVLIGGLFVSIGKIIDAFNYIRNNFPLILQTITAKITEFVNKIKQIPILSTAFNNIVNIFDKMKTIFTSLIGIVVQFFSSFSSGTTKSTAGIQSLTNGMNIFQKAGEGLSIVFTVLKNVVGGLVLVLAGAFNTVVSLIKSLDIGNLINKIAELINKIADLRIVKTAIDTFRSSGGNLIEVLKAVISEIRAFFEELRANGISVLDFFIEKIRNVAEAIKDFFGSFKSNHAKELTNSIKSQSSVFEFLKDKFKKAKEVIIAGLDKIRDEGLLTKVLMVAYVMAILKALVQIPNAISRVSKSLTGEGGIFTNVKLFTQNLTNFVSDLRNGVKEGTSLFGSLREAVINWGNAQRKSKIELLGGLLRDIAISIGILAASLAVLTLVDADKLQRVAIILGVFSAVLIAVAGAITYASQTNLVKSSWFSSFAANILAMTASIGILGGLLLAFSKVEISDVWGALRILGSILLLIVAMGAVMEKMAGLDFKGTTLRSSIFMIAFALSLKTMVKAFNEAAKIEIVDVNSFILSIIGIFGGLAVLIGIASAISPASALAIVAIVFALSKIIASFQEMITSINSGDLVAIVAEAKDQIMIMVIFVSAMVTVLTIAALEISAKLILAGAAIGKGLLQVGAAFLLFGLGLAMIQSAIKKMSKLDLLANDMQGLSSLLIILGSVVLAFAGLLGLTNKLGGVDTALLKIAGAIALLSVAVFNISVVAHIVKNLEWGPILKAISILIAIMASMAIMTAAVKAGNGTLAFKTVLATVLGFTLLIGALIVLGLMCDNQKVFEDLGKALALIVGLMMSMALVLAQVSKINTGQSCKPILSMVVMFGAVFAALYVLSQNVHNWTDILVLGSISAIILGTIWSLIKLTESLTTFAKVNNLGKSKAVTKSLALVGVMLAAFAAVATVLGVFAYATKGIDVEDMAIKVASIIGTLYLLVISAEKLTTMTKAVNLGDFGKMAAIMGAMIVALVAVSGVVALIGLIDMGPELVKKVTVVGLVLAELVGLTILMGKFGTATSKTFAALGALAIMTVIFGALAAVCVALNLVPAENGTLAKSQIIMLVLLELIGLNALLGLLVKAGGVALWGAVGSLCLIPLIAIFGLLALVCGAISLVPCEGVLAKSQIIMLVLLELIGLNALLGLLVVQSALGAVGSLCLIPLIAIFGLLALVCGAISLVPCEGMLPKTQTIMLVLLELELLLGLLGVISPLAASALLAVPGLLSVCLALVGIAATLKLLEGYSIDNMEAILDVLIEGLLKLVGVGVLASVASAGLLALGEAILMIGKAGLAAGVGVLKFAEGIAMLASTTPQQLDNLNKVIIQSCNAIAAGVYTIITTTGNAIVEAINTIIVGIVAAIYAGVSLLFSAGEDSGTSLYKGFEEKAMEITKLPGDIVSTLISALNPTLGTIYKAGLQLGKMIEEGFRDALGWHSPIPFIDYFFGDANAQIAKDGAETAKTAGDAGFNIGTWLKDKFNDTVKNWNLDSIKQKGLDAVNSLTSGLKLGEGNLIGEVNFLNGILGQLANARNLAARGFSSAVGDYKYQQEVARNKLVAKRNAIDYVNGTKAQRAEYVKLNDEIKKYDENIKSAAKTMGMAEEASAALDLSLNNTADGFGKAGGAAKEAKDPISDFYDMIEGSISLFDKFEQEEAMSSEELLENMASQITGLTNWSNQIQELATKGIDLGLLKKLAEMGPSGQKYVGAFVNMTADQLAQANSLYQQSLLLPQHVTAQVFSSFSLAGQNATQGFVDGLDHDAVRDQGIAFAHSFLDNFNAALGIHSPSDETFASAKYSVLGFIDGWESMMYLLEKTIEEGARKILMWFNTELGIAFGISTKTTEIGEAIVEGIKKGIEDGPSKSGLLDTISKLCQDIVDTAMDKINSFRQEASTSVSEGLSSGVTDGMQKVSSSTETSSNKMLGQIRRTMAKASAAISDDMDDPVIKPVLDLSNVEEGSKKLNSMLSRNSAISASGAFTNLQNKQWNSQTALLNATMDNGDVVNAIGNLSGDISDLKEAMTNIRMVLDTGAVVGAITPVMDKRLGIRKMYAERGM